MTGHAWWSSGSFFNKEEKVEKWEDEKKHVPRQRNRGAIFWEKLREKQRDSRTIFLLSSPAVEPHIWLHVGQINARLSGNSGLTPPTGNVVLGMPRHPPNLQTDSPDPSLFPFFPFLSHSLSLAPCLSFPPVCQHKPPKPQQFHCWRAEINREGLTWSDLSTATPVHSLR